jgi:hypothetical protein
MVDAYLETSLKVAPGVTVAFKGNKGADVCVDYSNGDIFASRVSLMSRTCLRSAPPFAPGLPSGMKVGGFDLWPFWKDRYYCL